MKKKQSALIILPLLIIIYLSGPEIKTDMSVPEISSIDDPEQYISKSETGILDMRPENDKKILWAGKINKKTEYSLVYIHGFTASRKETSPLTEIVSEKTGSNVFFTRLKGHGRYELRSQENTDIEDWLFDAEEAFEIGRKIGKKVIVISCSTGTALASWLAENHPDDIAAVIMISPNFEPADKRIFLLSHKWGPVLAKIIEGEILGEKENIVSADHANNWSYIYRTEMVYPLVALLKYTRNADFSNINIPFLMFYSSKDQVVNQKKSLEVFEKWGSEKKDIYEIKNPGDKKAHIIAGDIFSPKTTDFTAEKIIKFINSL